MTLLVSAVTARPCTTCTDLTNRWVPSARRDTSHVALLCPRCARHAGHLPARNLGGRSIDMIAADVEATYGTPVPELTDTQWQDAQERWTDLMDPNVFGAAHAAVLAVAHAAGIHPTL